MADVSAEPSMEEILSSIKRIIAEEEGAPARRRGATRPAAPESDDFGGEGDGAGDDTILELSQPLAADQPTSRPFAPPPVTPAPAVPRPAAQPVSPPEPAAALPPPAPAPASAPAVPTAAEEPSPEQAEPIVSAHAVDATRGALDSLSRLIVRPTGSGGEETLEGLVRELLKPMLRDWLDAKLPGIVETMVAREIARISGRDA